MHLTRTLTSLALAATTGLAALVSAPAATAAPVPTPKPWTITGPDFSHWAHPGERSIDWDRLAVDRERFVFMKATEGTTYVDRWFARDWSEAKRVGIARGAYHFANPSRDLGTAKAQARHFVRTVGSLDHPGDLPPVLDLESDGGLGSRDLIAWTRTWLRAVERATGRTPIIYTGMYFWRDQMANTTEFARHPLWIAYYPSNPSSRPWSVGGWKSWTFWQYTSSQQLAGVPQEGSDHSVYAGSIGSLDRLANRKAGYRDPTGAVTRIAAGARTITARGWAVDVDTRRPIAIRVRVDGHRVRTLAARLRVGHDPTVHPIAGRDRAFRATVTARPGRHRVCIRAINVGHGSSSTLRCETVRVG